MEVYLRIDDDGFWTGETDLFIPGQEMPGYYPQFDSRETALIKPKLVDGTWVEGATEDEINTPSDGSVDYRWLFEKGDITVSDLAKVVSPEEFSRITGKRII